MDVLFIGKSIGTVVLSKWCASEHEINAKQIWYTPVEAAFSFHADNVVAFIGDADPWSDVDVIKEKADACGIPRGPIFFWHYAIFFLKISFECEDIFLLFNSNFP